MYDNDEQEQPQLAFLKNIPARKHPLKEIEQKQKIEEMRRMLELIVTGMKLILVGILIVVIDVVAGWINVVSALWRW